MANSYYLKMRAIKDANKKAYEDKLQATEEWQQASLLSAKAEYEAEAGNWQDAKRLFNEATKLRKKAKERLLTE